LNDYLDKKAIEMKTNITSDFLENSNEAYWKDFHSQTSNKLPDKTVFSNIDPLGQVDHIVMGCWKASRKFGIVCYNTALWFIDSVKKEQHLVGFYSYRKHSFKGIELGIIRLPYNEIRIIRWRSSNVNFFIDGKPIGFLTCSWWLRYFGLGTATIEHNNAIFVKIKTGLLTVSSPQIHDKCVQLTLNNKSKFSIVIHPKDVFPKGYLKEISPNAVKNHLNKLQHNFVLNTKPDISATPIFPDQTGAILNGMQLEDKALLLGIATWLSGRNTA